MSDEPLAAVEELLLGGRPTLTQVEVAERAGMPLELAQELWRLLGFPHADDDTVAFTEGDVEALRHSRDLMELGILGPESQAALVRTWARSFARLAEWQTSLLTQVAGDGEESPELLTERLTGLASDVIPRVESLQSYIWRRHLASAAGRALEVDPGTSVSEQAVGFVDIVGYTSRSKGLDEGELVDWLEHFEDAVTGLVVDHGGQVIKTIGDEVLFVADEAAAAAEVALRATERGADEEDRFPAVRAGVAHGRVLRRLGDVYGPVVNIAARLTSVARPGTVLVDRGAYEALSGRSGEEGPGAAEDSAGPTDDPTDGPTDDPADGPAAGTPYTFRRMRRTPVKGYAKLQPWVLRRG